MKAELFYQIVTGFNPTEKKDELEKAAATQSHMSGANSEAYASDIHIDPLVLKDGDTVLEYFQKLLEISFTLMVMMHA